MVLQGHFNLKAKIPSTKTIHKLGAAEWQQ